MPVTLMMLLSIILPACGVSPSSQEHTDKINVVASFYPLAFFASQIVGHVATVISITPPGVEPHEYELSTQDLILIEQADLLIVNGEHFEPWSENISENLRGRIPIVTASEGLATLSLNEEDHTGQDPHVWLDPLLAKREIQKISEALKLVDPSHATIYDDNEQRLLERLDALNESYRVGLKHCETRTIVTSHAAFGYLAHAYQLKQVAIAGLSTEEEPSARQLADVAKFVKENSVQYIFFESLVSPKLAETLATETGVQTLKLNPLEGLTHEEINAGKDYFSIMEHNLTNLRTALSCR